MLQHAQGIELRYVGRGDQYLLDVVAPDEVRQVVDMAEDPLASGDLGSDR